MGKEKEWQDQLAAIDMAPAEALKELKRERDVLDERLRQMEALKAEVADAVYLRVRADYEARVAQLEEQSVPLRARAREQYAALGRLLERFTADHEAVTLDRQEIELRHKLGEFDTKEYQRRLKELEGVIAQRSEARSRAQELRQRFLEAVREEGELLAAAAPPPYATQEQPAAAPAPPPPPAAAAAPARAPSETQVLPALDIASLPRTVSGAAPGAGATVVMRAARLVPQTPEAGKNAIVLGMKPLSFGADGANDVRIGGAAVDPRHAQITVSMAGYTVVDMSSSHGTRVNAEKVRERLLRDQDVIQIGAARWVFREG
ncbi:MAG TPA: FHA domain-containing protein [Rhodanobacteraceae bacterium]|nr:FHA domain-containing protein [Rhodanobacteraceae bacterium]